MDPDKQSLSKKIIHSLHVVYELIRNVLVALAMPVTSIGTTGAIVGIATIGCTMLILGTGIDIINQNPSDTQLEFQNNGSTWLHAAASLTNVTMADGSKKTVYLDMWIKPGGNVVLDLSQLLGYQDQQVPGGTQFTFSAYKNILSPSGGGSGTLDLNAQGGSGGQQNSNIFNSQFPGLPLEQLPSGITDSKIAISSNPSDGLGYFNGIVPSGSVFEQENIIINADGSVTITGLVSPELCRTVTLPA